MEALCSRRESARSEQIPLSFFHFSKTSAVQDNLDRFAFGKDTNRNFRSLFP